LPSRSNTMSEAVASFTKEHTLSERSLKAKNRERKKRVVVTGGSGRLGRCVVREMVEHGWEVYNLDITPPLPSEADVAAKFVRTDLTDYGQVVAQFTEQDSLFKGIDAVIHLAAIPSPEQAPNHVIFHTNIRQTYNVLEAARVCGIKSVALASSETVFGLPLYPHSPTKLPVTEEVERPESSYSLSKLMGEKMSEQYVRWDPTLKVINIRLSNVMLPADYAKFPKFQNDPASRAWNGFCYIDGRDCAQAFRLATESDLKGTHVFNIANADIAFTTPTAELVKEIFPNIDYTPETKDPREGLISIKKARELLGFDPKYDWQSEVEKLKKDGKA